MEISKKKKIILKAGFKTFFPPIENWLNNEKQIGGKHFSATVQKVKYN